MVSWRRSIAKGGIVVEALLVAAEVEAASVEASAPAVKGGTVCAASGLG